MTKQLVLPFENPRRVAARDLWLERLDRKGKAREARLEETRAHEREGAMAAAIARLAGDADALAGLADAVTYAVECNSSYFECPPSVTLVDEMPSAVAAAVAAAVKARAKPVSSAGPGAARRAAAGGRVAEATLSTPRAADPVNAFNINFHPKAPGVYQARLTLRSPRDTRVYAIEAVVSSPGVKREMEFVVPARQAISQDIPIVNPTEGAWTVAAALSGDRAFSGPPSITVAARSSASYALTFKPAWVCEVAASLVLTVRAWRYAFPCARPHGYVHSRMRPRSDIHSRM